MRSRVPFDLFVRKILLRNPLLAMKLFRGLYHKHVRADLDYLRKDGIASKPPIQISLRITNACNHRCAVCGQYGSRGYMNTDKSGELMKTLPVDTYKKLLDEVAPYKPILYVTGGEPFLYKGLVELMDYAKSLGMTISVVTNGVLLKKYASEIVRSGWDMILVSFDGPEEIHDKCRNLKGAFKTSYSGLLELKKMKKKMGKTYPLILTSTTLSGTNAPYLEECFEIGRKIHPDLMILYLSWFTSDEIGKEQTAILKKAMGVDAYTWKSYATSFSERDAKQLADAVRAIKKRRWPFDYFIIPDVEPLEDYYLHPEELFGYSKCVAPFIMVDVMPNGDVVTCRDFIDVKVGNISEEPLLKIWNNSRFVKWRKLLIKHKGTLPQCSRCCGLMGF
jgi:radical SAM protein with 4Fe4S-binding SPASM domain